MKARMLYFCPQDENMLLFEEVYDELQDFIYEPLLELPQACPKCGRLLYKKDCVTVEELFKAVSMQNPSEAKA